MKLQKVILGLSACILFILLLVPGRVFASEVISSEKMKITIGYCPFGMLETPVMKVKKFYKKYLPELEVEWFFGLYSVHLINNWIAGKLEIAYMGDMPAIMLEEKVRNTKWVSVAVYPHGEVAAIFVPNNSSIRSVKELNGKSVAVGIGSSHHRILDVIAADEGIRFNLVNQAPEVAIGNLEAGKIDAWCPWPPYIELAKHKKIGKVLIGDCCKYEPEVNAIWPFVVSERFAEKHPKIVEGLVRADIDLHRFMEGHPEEAARIVYKELEEKIPFPVIAASLASYRYSDRLEQEQINTMQRGIDFLKSKGFIKKGFKAADWADPTFINKALAKEK